MPDLYNKDAVLEASARAMAAATRLDAASNLNSLAVYLGLHDQLPIDALYERIGSASE